MARDRVLSVIVTSAPLRRRFRRLPAVLAAQFSEFRRQHGAVIAFVACWIVAGADVRFE